MQIEWLGRFYCPVSTLEATWDAHVKDIGKAVCGSSSSGSWAQVTSDMQMLSWVYVNALIPAVWQQ